MSVCACIYVCICVYLCVYMCVFVTRVQSIGTFSQGGFIIDRHTMWEFMGNTWLLLFWSTPAYHVTKVYLLLLAAK